jgi:signal transduction histidine kinase
VSTPRLQFIAVLGAVAAGVIVAAAVGALHVGVAIAAVLLVVLAVLPSSDLREAAGSVVGAAIHAALVAATGGPDSLLVPLFGVGPIVSATMMTSWRGIIGALVLATAGGATPFLYADAGWSYALLLGGNLALWVVASVTVGTMVHRLADKTDQLLRADRIRSQLLEAVPHEFRTPLTVVTGTAELLAARGHLMTVDQRRRLTQSLQRNTTRLHLLLADLLELDRLQRRTARLDVSDVDVVDLVRQVLDELPAGQSERLELAPSGEIRGSLDADRVQRAVEALVANIFRHTPPDSHGRIRVVQRRGEIVLEVDDDGPGIPVAQRSRLLEPFAQGEPATRPASPGLGIGLAYAHQIAELHRGSLRLDDSPDLGGTRVTLCLPHDRSLPVPASRHERVRDRVPSATKR